jgi:hypothetical protein
MDRVPRIFLTWSATLIVTVPSVPTHFPDPLSWEHNLGVAKPWKCRLRLHDWDYRENPETHEHYQVCLRCNAYRDRGSAAPGARTSWGGGGY